MDPRLEQQLLLTRRRFFGRTSVGIGTAALASLLGEDLPGASQEKAIGALPSLPHFAPKAKRIIYLLQGGAPSHVDLFDYKPQLAKRRGQELPASVQMGQRLTTMTAGQKTRPVLPGIASFKQDGKR